MALVAIWSLFPLGSNMIVVLSHRFYRHACCCETCSVRSFKQFGSSDVNFISQKVNASSTGSRFPFWCVREAS